MSSFKSTLTNHLAGNFRLICLYRCISSFSACVWSLKSVPTNRLAGNFSLICLDRCVSMVDLPIPAVPEIGITLWCCACSNSLSKSSPVYVCVCVCVCVCVNSRYQYIYVLFLSLLAHAAKGVSLTFLSLPNESFFLDAADRVLCILLRF